MEKNIKELHIRLSENLLFFLRKQARARKPKEISLNSLVLEILHQYKKNCDSLLTSSNYNGTIDP